jgi:hypothetical protein
VDFSGDYAHSVYRFEWEREWPHVGNRCFSITRSAFLVIPEWLHEAARFFFARARDENIGSCYECPFLDPGWDGDRIFAIMDWCR